MVRRFRRTGKGSSLSKSAAGLQGTTKHQPHVSSRRSRHRKEPRPPVDSVPTATPSGQLQDTAGRAHQRAAGARRAFPRSVVPVLLLHRRVVVEDLERLRQLCLVEQVVVEHELAARAAEVRRRDCQRRRDRQVVPVVVVVIRRVKELSAGPGAKAATVEAGAPPQPHSS